MLDLMSAPKQWQMSDGDVAEVHTPFTTRAKELMELYQGLNLPLLSIDERLDVLLHVKWTVKEFDCNLTRNIVELIDREADLLNRGRAEKSLEGLRRRLSNMFLRFIETPEFNPEAARFQKVPRDLMGRPDVRPITSGLNIKSRGTFWNLAASGLNSGVSIKRKNILLKRLLKPSKLFSALPRFNKSASRSINSTILRVKLQSNSFTVHFTCNNTSNLSSIDNNGKFKP
jgi:hypothetical protein